MWSPHRAPGYSHETLLGKKPCGWQDPAERQEGSATEITRRAAPQPAQGQTAFSARPKGLMPMRSSTEALLPALPSTLVGSRTLEVTKPQSQPAGSCITVDLENSWVTWYSIYYEWKFCWLQRWVLLSPILSSPGSECGKRRLRKKEKKELRKKASPPPSS